MADRRNLVLGKSEALFDGESDQSGGFHHPGKDEIRRQIRLLKYTLQKLQDPNKNPLPHASSQANCNYTRKTSRNNGWLQVLPKDVSKPEY